MMTHTRLLTDTEAAELLQMLTARLKRLAKAGKVPCVRLPDGELRFDSNDLAAWVEVHKQPARAEVTA